MGTDLTENVRATQPVTQFVVVQFRFCFFINLRTHAQEVYSMPQKVKQRDPVRSKRRRFVSTANCSDRNVEILFAFLPSAAGTHNSYLSVSTQPPRTQSFFPRHPESRIRFVSVALAAQTRRSAAAAIIEPDALDRQRMNIIETQSCKGNKSGD